MFERGEKMLVCLLLLYIHLLLFIYFQRIVITASDLPFMEVHTMFKQCRIKVVNSRFVCECKLNF